jgi:hypothetical protein
MVFAKEKVSNTFVKTGDAELECYIRQDLDPSTAATQLASTPNVCQYKMTTESAAI